MNNITANIQSHSRDFIKPGIIGRVLRILLGVFLGGYFVRFVSGWVIAIQQGDISLHQTVYTPIVHKGNLAFYGMYLIVMIFLPYGTRKVGAIAALIVAPIMAAANFVVTGDWWGLPFAAVVSLIIAAWLAFFALANILAGIIANPG